MDAVIPFSLSRLKPCLAWLVLIPCLASAQSFAISGTVFDPQGLPVAGASVSLLGANRVLITETRTTTDGSFRLERLPAGRYELVVRAAGFSPFRRVVQLPSDDALIRVGLSLTPAEYQVTVTGGHGLPEDALVEPATIRTRASVELHERDLSHLPRMLAEEPGVVAQETSPGQGSPTLRGQGAQTVLYLVDGIRFNNSTYRSGNTQYLGWVPAAVVDAAEVSLGPAGTQHGSDALGGAINLISARAPPWSDAGFVWGAETRALFSSADLGAGAELNAHAAGRNVTLRLIGSWKRAQELRPGGGVDSHNVLVRFLGFTPEQARSVLGSRLQDTDYAHTGWNARLGVRLPATQFLTATWIQAEQYGIQRYDRLLGGEGNRISRFAPQRLGFGYLRYSRLSPGALRSVEATFSLNRQTDGQISQVRDTAPLQHELARVTAPGYLFSATVAPGGEHVLTAGAELYDEFIFGRRIEIPPGAAARDVRARFPNGSRYQSLAAYLVDDWDVVRDRVRVDAGTRFSRFRFRTRARDNPVMAGVPSVPDAVETFRDLTFHAGAAVTVRPALILFGRVARGFRAPSAFDLGELGLTGGGFEISPREALALGAQVGDSAGRRASSTGRAWTALAPESLWSFETGWRWNFSRVRGDLTAFHSEALDSIQRRTLIVPSPASGLVIGNQPVIAQDAAGRIFVALDDRPVVSRANIGRVRIQGLETSTRIEWAAQWSSLLKGSLAYGREIDTGQYARRIAPAAGLASLRWSQRAGRFWFEAYTEFSGPQTRLNPSELDDARIGAVRTGATITDFFEFGARRLGLVQGQRLVATGETAAEVVRRVLGPSAASATALPLYVRTRGFATLNFRGTVRLNETTRLSFAATNLTDSNYRRHGSGFDSPGAGLSLSLTRTLQ